MIPNELPDRAPKNTELGSTQWSVVFAAAGKSVESEEALEFLCKKFWYPLYAFVRRKIDDADEARDLTQEFFASLIEKNYIGDADPARGRFRTFLFASMKNFLSKHWEKQRAIKRGGAAKIFSIDFEAGERRYKHELVDHSTPERLFQQSWIKALTDNAMARLENEYQHAGKEDRFAVLKPFLVSPSRGRDLDAAAAALGLAPGNVRVTVHRMRKRYGEMIQLEIAETVQEQGEIEEEIHQLFRSFEK